MIVACLAACRVDRVAGAIASSVGRGPPSTSGSRIQSERRVLVAAACGVIAFFALDRAGAARTSWGLRRRGISGRCQSAGSRKPVTATYAHQLRLLSEAMAATTPLPATPAMDSDLSRVSEAPTSFVVFHRIVRGARHASGQRSRAPLAASLKSFASAIRDTNRDAVSAYVESPTYGGCVVAGARGACCRAWKCARRGPTRGSDRAATTRWSVHSAGEGFLHGGAHAGLRGSVAGGRVYGFDEIYGADRLAYDGARVRLVCRSPISFRCIGSMRARGTTAHPRAPLFVFFPTISPHFPFSPTPPYQPDWHRLSSPQVRA